MQLEITENGKKTVKEIKDFAVIGSKLQVSVFEKTKTTVEETMWSKKEVKETSYIAEDFKLGKNVEVKIKKNNKTVYEYKTEEAKDVCDECN